MVFSASSSIYLFDIIYILYIYINIRSLCDGETPRQELSLPGPFKAAGICFKPEPLNLAEPRGHSAPAAPGLPVYFVNNGRFYPVILFLLPFGLSIAVLSGSWLPAGPFVLLDLRWSNSVPCCGFKPLRVFVPNQGWKCSAWLINGFPSHERFHFFAETIGFTLILGGFGKTFNYCPVGELFSVSFFAAVVGGLFFFFSSHFRSSTIFPCHCRGDHGSCGSMQFLLS